MVLSVSFGVVVERNASYQVRSSKKVQQAGAGVHFVGGGFPRVEMGPELGDVRR